MRKQRRAEGGEMGASVCGTEHGRIKRRTHIRDDSAEKRWQFYQKTGHFIRSTRTSRSESRGVLNSETFHEKLMRLCQMRIKVAKRF
jgi:hypothetical protein